MYTYHPQRFDGSRRWLASFRFTNNQQSQFSSACHSFEKKLMLNSRTCLSLTMCTYRLYGGVFDHRYPSPVHPPPCCNNTSTTSVCPGYAARCQLLACPARVLLPTSAPFCNFECNLKSTNTTLTSAPLDTRPQVADVCSKFKHYWWTCIFLFHVMSLFHSLGFKLGFL